MAVVGVPLSERVGVELRGLDLARPVTAADAEAVRQALWRHGVVALRGQRPTPARFVAFCEALGELEPFFTTAYNHPDQPEIYVLSNVREGGRPIGRDGAGTHWHSDHTFMPEPASVTLLHCVDAPEEGGDTLFVDACAAYDDLPAGTKRRIEGLRAIHRYQKKEFVFSGEEGAAPELKRRIEALRVQRLAEDVARPAPSASARAAGTLADQLQPVVRVHPATGRRALYLNDEMTVGVEGLPEDEGRALLRELRLHATRPERVFRYRWRKGDVVAWDNAGTLHCATYVDPGAPRTMHRITLRGTAPVCAGAAS